MPETNNSTPPARLSGGEIPPTERKEWLHLHKLISAEPDVHQILALSKVGKDRWLYLIQTPFATWPKFVIGETDAENKKPHPICCTGTEWTARDEWAALNSGDHR